MVKKIHAKSLQILLLLICFTLLCCLSACGNKADTATATTSSGQQISLSGSPTSLASGQNSILTATVTDDSGNPVSGQTVTFTLFSTQSNIPLLNGKTSTTATTDAAGRVLAIYTAGTNTTTADVEDTIEASIGTTVIVYAFMTVTPNATTTSGVYQIALTANVTSLAAGQSSTLTATVTDGSGNSVSGQPVAFTISSINSSSPLLNGTTTTTATITTDAAGRAVAVYTAGTNTTTSSIQDTIKASASTTAIGYVIMTVTPNTAVTSGGYQMSLTANLTSLAAGQNSILTATVTDGSGNPVSGQTVTFTLFSTNSNSPLLNGNTTTPATITTDAAGRALVVYTAGANSTTTSIQDIVKASIGTTATGYVIMTVTAGSSSSTGVRLTVTATPTSLVAGAMSVIVAQVLNADGTAASGQEVTFGFVGTPASGATIANLNGITTAPVTGITDADGTAVAVYTAGNSSPSLSIQDAISASVTGATGSSADAAIITRLPAVGTGNRIISFTSTPTSDPTTLLNSNYAILTVKVTTDDLTTPVANEPVTFSIMLDNSTGYITRIDNGITRVGYATTPSTLTVNTDNNGEAFVIFDRNGAVGSGETVVRAQISDTINGGDAALIVYWTAIAGGGVKFDLTPGQGAVFAGSPTTLTATLTDGSGNGISGQIVTFAVIANGSGGSFTPPTPLTATTDGNGNASLVWTTGSTPLTADNFEATVSYGGSNYTAVTIVNTLMP